MTIHKVFSESRTFDEICLLAKEGKITLKDLTQEDFFQYYIIEKKSDSQIAEALKCNKKSVSAKRQKLGITIQTQVLYETCGLNTACKYIKSRNYDSKN